LPSSIKEMMGSPTISSPGFVFSELLFSSLISEHPDEKSNRQKITRKLSLGISVN
jgi:hypothetical protein